MRRIMGLMNKYFKYCAVSFKILAVLVVTLFIVIVFSSKQAHSGVPVFPADIQIEKSVIDTNQNPIADSECTIPGDQESQLDYSITVFPFGDFNPQNVVIYDELPIGSELISAPDGAICTLNSITPFNCSFGNGQVISCNLGTLHSPQTLLFSLNITPPPGSNSIVNKACGVFVRGFCSDDNSHGCNTNADCCQNDCVQIDVEEFVCSCDGNTCGQDQPPCTQSTCETVTKKKPGIFASCTVAGSANVTISKISTSNPGGQCVNANESADISYDITLSNVGAIPEQSVEVIDQLPSGVSVQNITIQGNSTAECSVSNELIMCNNFGSLDVGSTVVISVTINVTPNASDFQIVNSATVNTSTASQTTQSIVCVNPGPPTECNPNFEGVFCNTITVLPDSDTLSISVDNGSSLSGIFNSGNLQGVEISGGCQGDLVSFSGFLDGTCEITGTLSLTNPNTINITASSSSEGCDAPISIDGTLIRLGTNGGSGDGSGSGGCSIAQSNSQAGAKSMFVYLLIPSLLFLRRFKNRIVKKNYSFQNTSNWLKTLLIITTAVAGFYYISNSPAQAQSNCRTSNFLLSTRADCQETVTSATQPEEVLTQLLSINSQKQFKTIRSHLAELRAGGGSNGSLQSLARRMGQLGSTPLLAFNSDATSITNLSLFNQAPENGSDTFSRLGAFVNGSFNFGDRKNVNNSGYDFDIFNIIGGLDYRFTDYLIIGASFNYTYTDAELKSSNGQFTSNAYYGTLYGSLYWESFYVDAFGSIGGANYDIERAIDNSLQKGKPSGVLYQLAISTGYEFYKSGFSFTPYGRLEYDQNNLGSYTEQTVSGDPALALKFRKQEVKSFTSALGAQAAYNWSINWGVLRPEILFEWIHEFEDNPDTVTASFVSSQGLPGDPTFSVNPPSIDANFFNLGGGLYAIFPHGFSIFVYYERTLAYNDMNANYITGGLRKEF